MKGRNAQVSRIYMILNILEGAPHGLSTREIHTRLADRGFEVEMRMLAPLKDTPFYQDLQTSFDKISEKLAKNSQVFLDELQDEVIFEAGPRWGLAHQICRSDGYTL